MARLAPLKANGAVAPLYVLSAERVGGIGE